ncbi:hypothetical protein KBI51_01425 [Aerococcaceae bacterium zg-ZUI334]|uniref:hypothetical protein n=1 Tax=Aerococcaceae TaxID=186827 RepID=UPI0013B995E9|nr:MULTISPECIES: hypothetical protein [unclassified Facklamia]MBR7926836.1 hypothetical protein [Aerococcaceae bacterium zg-ZUI334]MBS4461017.1 hypothetical protein [Aerococcaceae bacterium zg-B36]QQD64944.1 hypothetical protein JDW14_06320 [Aerococcaceae bacterium zg-252]NEW64789.1 hypothetical protein [Facklamia sp. 252]NEW68111.1 hypothetical protein [Facklamia sp. 253]
MKDKINHAEAMEKEISKQIDEIDKHLDRGGLLSLILVVVAIFVIGYWIIDFFRIRDDNPALSVQSQVELMERIDELEQRIETLELQLGVE